jgi:uncharacterized membrane protein YgdD (TMEM256/DUF423 family)
MTKTDLYSITIDRFFISIGGVSAAVAVILGAYGAHTLKGGVDPSQFEAFNTASSYHLIHSVALVLVGILYRLFSGSRFITWSGWFFIAGMLLFSGSLYLKIMAGLNFGLSTPMGGVCFIFGWVLLGVSSLRSV